MSVMPRTSAWTSEMGGENVTFRHFSPRDKELFRDFIRSLPPKDNYYLLVDVRSDEAIERLSRRLTQGHTIGVVALQAERMIGYCSLETNALPWIAHTGDIRMSVAPDYRGRGIGRALANEVFVIARARGLEKIWTRMASGQAASQSVFESLGFRAEAVLSDFVKNEDGRTEDLIIMSFDAGRRWQL